jgi:hypothetical protein
VPMGAASRLLVVISKCNRELPARN